MAHNPQNTSTIKTVLRKYKFFLDKENSNWQALRNQLEKREGSSGCFETSGQGSHYLDWIPDEGVEVELELSNLFNNQWNTKCGKRVFDWALDYKPFGNPNLKRGHYLEITQEMIDVRNNNVACGWCGKYYDKGAGLDFCTNCLGTEYLKEEELYLLRLKPISFKGERRALTDEEQSRLLPLYVQAQTKRFKAKTEALRQELIDAHAKNAELASEELNGMLWLLDHEIPLNNVIYYKHCRSFGFGWRQPYGEAVKAELLRKLEGFPFKYEFKTWT